VRAVADRVEAASQRGIAIELLREVLQLTPGDINVRYRLGSLLSLDTTTRDEARELLTQVVQLAPHSPVARLGLAWTFHEDAPAQGLAVLEPCLAALDQAGPELLEAAGVLACASGDHARGAELRERAIGAYETPEQGRMALAQDHLDAMRYDLAAELVLPLRDADLGADTLSLQGLLLCACRMSGRQLELHAWVREHSRERVPDHLAFETFQAYRNADPELAARASDVLAQNATSQAGALEARIHAAGCRAVLGRPAELEALTQQIGDNGPAWALVYFAWVDAKRFDRAAEAAARAHALAPFDLQALSAWEGHCLRLGDKAGALGAAQSALEHHPYQHLGNERLAQLYARELNAEAALAHSRRAVMLAPYCHIAQTAHALALFAADDFERARAHAERAVAIEALEPGRWSEALSLLHALRGEHEALEQQLEARAREEPRWPFPELDAKLRAVCDAAARV
jgi:tetratricopeptide (TPR) repeat protein